LVERVMGRIVRGCLAGSAGLAVATGIAGFGGWRDYLAKNN